MNISGYHDLPKQGLFHSIVSELIPPPPKPKKSRVVILGCGLKIHFPWAKACERYQNAIQITQNAVSDLPVDILYPQAPYEEADEMISYLDHQLSSGIDGIIFFHSAYTAGEIGLSLGKWLLDHPTPLLSWAWPETGTGQANEANSLTCQNFLLNMWNQMHVPYIWMHQEIGTIAIPFIQKFLRASHARQSFKKAKLLHVGGSRVTAFYDGEVDELSVASQMGCRFDRVDLEAIHQHAKKVIPDSALLKIKKALVEHPLCSSVSVPEDQILKTYRFGLGILDLASRHDYLGATVKSWPDLFDCYGCAIDGAVSLMNDYGFCVTEEGEMNGLLSSLALFFLSDGKAVPTMMDLSIWKQNQERLGIWHCGASSTRLLRKGTQFAATRHSILENGNPDTAVGLKLEFLLELGPITVHRYMAPKANRYFAFEGAFVESDLDYRGSYGLMQATDRASISQIMGTIFDHGLDHHWSVGYGHWYEELKILHHFLKIEEVPLRKSSDPFGFSKNSQ